MSPADTTPVIAHAIQLAIAPVFLLTGIAALASWAINFCTSAALLVCIVIATLFFEAFFGRDLKWLAGALFVSAMIALIGGLACFLREVYVATHTVRILSATFRR